MSKRIGIFVLVAAAAAVGFIRLGFWQLGRLRERRAENALLVLRKNEPVRALADLVRDTANARFRAVAFTGRYDYGVQFLWTARTRNGAPGVVFLTPMIVDSASGRAVLVNRGWVYAADGMHVNDSLWTEGVRDSVRGYVDHFGRAIEGGRVTIASVPRGIRRLQRDSLEAQLPYKLEPLVVIQQLGAGPQDTIRHPFRSEPPPLDEGPHRGYALQWFAFAFITAVGSIAVVVLNRQAV